MLTLYMILFLLSLACLLAGAFQVHAPRLNLVPLGLALFVAVFFIQTHQKL